ncbi:MAG: hypothetical protein RIC38_14940 [Chromatocurvus sp.]
MASTIADDSLAVSAVRLAEAEREGAYAVAIVEPAVATAALQQASGNHRTAIDHLRRAIHLRRIAEGLDTPSQIPLLERLLNSQLEIGDTAAAGIAQERLFMLRLGTAVDPVQRLKAVQQYSDWHRERYLSRESARPYLHLLAIHGAHGREIERLVSDPGADTSVQIAHLYGQLRVEYLVSDYRGGRTPVLQMHAGEGGTAAFAAVTDLEGERFRLMRKNNYGNGRATVERILDILERRSEPSIAEAARARIALGDWHMWWNGPALALANYRKAWHLYSEDGDPFTDPDSLFERPVVLPVEPLSTSRFSAEDPARHARARVSFSVSRLGEARTIRLLDIDASHDDGADIVMQRMLRGSRFRPVFENGDAVAARGIERTFSISY